MFNPRVNQDQEAESGAKRKLAGGQDADPEDRGAAELTARAQIRQRFGGDGAQGSIAMAGPVRSSSAAFQALHAELLPLLASLGREPGHRGQVSTIRSDLARAAEAIEQDGSRAEEVTAAAGDYVQPLREPPIVYGAIGPDEGAQMIALRLQMAMDRRSSLIALVSDIMKKQSSTQAAIIGNLK